MTIKKPIFFTITGMQFFYGHASEDYVKDLLKPGVKVTLEKEYDNKYDNEAILVKFPGLGDIGHVANSVHTVLGESYSAGRIYDRFGDTTSGTVYAVVPQGVICTLDE